MATRKKPAPIVNTRPALTLNIDPETLTLDEVGLFEPGGFTISGFKLFMAKYSNWTPAMVGGLTLVELRALSRDIGKAVSMAAVPKANAAN